MRNDKWIDGILPCWESENCPFLNKCGTDWDWKQPNAKKLVCLCKHIERLGYELYKRDEPNHKCTAKDYAYQMAWVMNHELAETVKLCLRWEEPKNSVENFFVVANIFQRFCENNEINFLKEQQQQMRMATACLSGRFPDE